MKKVLLFLIFAIGVQQSHTQEFPPKVVDLCHGGARDLYFYYTFCSSSTEITEVQGYCDASGSDYAIEVTSYSCSAWSEDWSDEGIFGTGEGLYAQKYCHECNVGDGGAVCSSSSDQAVVCAQVAEKTVCSAGLSYEDVRISCSDEAGETNITFAGCTVNGTYVELEQYSGPCGDLTSYGNFSGYGDTCYKCDGIGICGPPNSSCEELLSNSTASFPTSTKLDDLCSERGRELSSAYSFCSSSTDVTHVTVGCDASGSRYVKDFISSSCISWSKWDLFGFGEGYLAQKYCHECNVGDGSTVCSSSSDQAVVCDQVAEKTVCSAGLSYQDDRLSCSSETGEINVTLAGCNANGTYLELEDRSYSGPCGDYSGYGDTCYKCDGFNICGPKNSSCGELLNNNTALPTTSTALGGSDLLQVAAASCAVALLGSLLV